MENEIKMQCVHGLLIYHKEAETNDALIFQ
jgi:hypothetical protein